MSRFVALCFLGLVFVLTTARGAIVQVPGDQLTLRAAIAAAQDGDEIVLEPGVWGDTADSYGRITTRTLTLRNANPELECRVDVSVSGSDVRFVDLTVNIPAFYIQTNNERMDVPPSRLNRSVVFERCIVNIERFTSQRGNLAGDPEVESRLELISCQDGIGHFFVDFADVRISNSSLSSFRVHDCLRVVADSSSFYSFSADAAGEGVTIESVEMTFCSVIDSMFVRNCLSGVVTGSDAVTLVAQAVARLTLSVEASYVTVLQCGIVDVLGSIMTQFQVRSCGQLNWSGGRIEGDYLFEPSAGTYVRSPAVIIDAIPEVYIQGIDSNATIPISNATLAQVENCTVVGTPGISFSHHLYFILAIHIVCVPVQPTNGVPALMAGNVEELRVVDCKLTGGTAGGRGTFPLLCFDWKTTEPLGDSIGGSALLLQNANATVTGTMLTPGKKHSGGHGRDQRYLYTKDLFSTLVFEGLSMGWVLR